MAQTPIRIDLNQCPFTIANLHQILACLAQGGEVTILNMAIQEPASAILEFMSKLNPRKLSDEDKAWMWEMVRKAFREEVKAALTAPKGEQILTTITDMRASIDSIKAELGKGEVVTRERQTGKTTALLEFVHEYASGFCYIVVPNSNMAHLTADKYRRLYPDDERPIILTFQYLRNQTSVVGRPQCWVTDEVWPSAAERQDEALTLLTFLGGVGTSMCMDMHSR